MNAVRKVQVGIAIGTIIVIGIVSAAIWYAPNPELGAQKAKVNLAANQFVDICMKSLPNGDSTCDINLRQQMQETCQTDSSYDICKDGRVEQYYNVRDQAISQNIVSSTNSSIQANTTRTIINSIESTTTAAKEPDSGDWHCGEIVKIRHNFANGTKVTEYVLYQRDEGQCLPESGMGPNVQPYDFNNPPSEVTAVKRLTS